MTAAFHASTANIVQHNNRIFPSLWLVILDSGGVADVTLSFDKGTEITVIT